MVDIRRVPVRWPTGFFHPKNLLLLVEDEEPDEDGVRQRHLLVAALSANLTRAGWWENVEVCHVETLNAGEKSSLRSDVLRLISLVKQASPAGTDHSALEEIREAVSYGVVKMNVDTDTQYAFTRPVAGHMFTNYDGVLKIDGEVGRKKAYDPRSYLKLAEAGMAKRVVTACEDLLSAGTSVS